MYNTYNASLYLFVILTTIIYLSNVVLGFSTIIDSYLRPVVVIGKIIVDEYGDPNTNKPPNVSIGGGGPQAAWGAAAALFVASQRRNSLSSNDSRNIGNDGDRISPPSQPVMLLGPVGNDWNHGADTEALQTTIGPAIDVPPILITGEDYITPRIRLWHDENENIQWYAVNDSFGTNGADGLWRNRPSADDIISAINENSSILKNTQKDTISNHGDNDIDDGVILHCIAEAGYNATGNQEDAKPLHDERLVGNDNCGIVSFLGIEPIAFINEEEGRVSLIDAKALSNLIESIPSIDVISPDIHLATSLQGIINGSEIYSYHDGINVAVRDGPKGSIVYDGRHNKAIKPGSRNVRKEKIEVEDVSKVIVPSATLTTHDGKPVNPTGKYAYGSYHFQFEISKFFAISLLQIINTLLSIFSLRNLTGAGNAYAAAYTALLGNGFTSIEAACIANAVGATICEYEHIPPWTWSVLERIDKGANEIRSKMENLKTSTPM